MNFKISMRKGNCNIHVCCWVLDNKDDKFQQHDVKGTIFYILKKRNHNRNWLKSNDFFYMGRIDKGEN